MNNAKQEISPSQWQLNGVIQDKKKEAVQRKNKVILE